MTAAEADQLGMGLGLGDYGSDSSDGDEAGTRKGEMLLLLSQLPLCASTAVLASYQACNFAAVDGSNVAAGITRALRSNFVAST